jgi:ssDNA-binding Zn-finger/Zn-ribbon topoisomerase 1
MGHSKPKAIFLASTSHLDRGKKKANTMRYCPECGGELQYVSATKRYVCKSCGLSVTHQELIELRQQLRPRFETEEDQRQKERKEYLKWWLGKKK